MKQTKDKTKGCLECINCHKMVNFRIQGQCPDCVKKEFANPTITQALEEFDKKFGLLNAGRKLNWWRKGVDSDSWLESSRNEVMDVICEYNKSVKFFLQSKLEEAYQQGIIDYAKTHKQTLEEMEAK